MRPLYILSFAGLYRENERGTIARLSFRLVAEHCEHTVEPFEENGASSGSMGILCRVDFLVSHLRASEIRVATRGEKRNVRNDIGVAISREECEDAHTAHRSVNRWELLEQRSPIFHDVSRQREEEASASSSSPCGCKLDVEVE